MNITTYDPFSSLNYLFDSDSFFPNKLPLVESKTNFSEPLVNIIDGGQKFVIEASVPGYDKDEISIEVEGEILTLSGNKKLDKKTDFGSYSKKEFYFTDFKRSFRLTEEIQLNNISAEVKNGVLSVNLPKKEKNQPKKISILGN